MKLKPTLLLFLAMCVLGSASGCTFWKKSKKPKQNPALASEVEGDFRQRWMEHRMGEITAAGTDATTARTQAEAEFREKYPYIRDAKK
jgi:hypothetical protein